jgi:NO-binding membrane sensor protein with MHYT domain
VGPMGSTTELGFGWVTPILSYLMACVGAALGLRCMVRAKATAGARRLRWLASASVAIGTGIWTMHFIAMLGFSVTGSAIRYDGLLTIASLLVSIGVVGVGVLAVGYGRSRRRSVALGGLITGVGVAAMHYLGMSAMRVNGSVHYDARMVALSVVIAIVAATAALQAALTVTSPVAAVGASLIMGVAVSAMHYTGMAAARVDVVASGTAPPGTSGTDFIVPMTVMLGSYLFLASAFVALSLTAQGRSAGEPAGAVER